jgi:hypothetical protein
MILVAAIAVWFAAMRQLAPKTNLRSIWYLGDYALARIARDQISVCCSSSSRWRYC